jgi:hypothetical protein
LYCNLTFRCVRYFGGRSNPIKSTKKLFFQGDINEEIFWDEISEHKWDFSICTHTLEDIRDPYFVLSRLIKHSQAGFIAVPNKHTELSSIRSHLYVGYCHHRWVFTINDVDCLLIIAKWPGTAYFANSNILFRLFGVTPFLSKVERALGFRPGGRGLSWLNKKKADPIRYELGFIWEDSFDFKFINKDYAGHNELEMMELYRNELRNGL